MSRNRHSGNICGHSTYVRGAPDLKRLVLSLESVRSIKNGRFERYVSEKRGIEVSRTPHHVHIILRADDGTQFFDVTPRNGSKMCEMESQIKHVLRRKFRIISKEVKMPAKSIDVLKDSFYSKVYRVLRENSKLVEEEMVVEDLRQTLAVLQLSDRDMKRVQNFRPLLVPKGRNNENKAIYELIDWGPVAEEVLKEDNHNMNSATDEHQIDQEILSTPLPKANGHETEHLKPVEAAGLLDQELLARALEALFEKNDLSNARLRVKRQEAEAELERIQEILLIKKAEIEEINSEIRLAEETNTKILENLENLR